MQLAASRTAQYLIQTEYHQVELQSTLLILSSQLEEEHIPFHVWNGEVTLKRGLLWGSIQFFAHEESGERHSWLVQGLPWEECREFVRHAIASYQRWHHDQCEQLNQILPNWEKELKRLTHLPSFLSHSQVAAWSENVFKGFSDIDMTLEEATQRMPNRMKALEPWLLEPESTLLSRNDQWLETERLNWGVLFSQLESSPLNVSQQKAVLLNDDHNLILAGAGSGKTSVLTARVAYLLQSHTAQPEELLLLAFGREAASEMSQRIADKIGLAGDHVKVSTFHKLGLHIINEVENQRVEVSPIAVDTKQREAWCIDWLKKHWMTPTNFKRWQKHLSTWPIAYLAGDDELGSHVENPKLIAWLEKQLTQLSASGLTKNQIQEKLISHRDYTRLNSEIGLVWPCYQAWQQMLKEQNQIDFNMMIRRATQYVVTNKFKSQWRYIMIDEYQDISPDRLALIEALCHQPRSVQERECVLFAVGDDWQSIYQFAGSDVDLTTGFEARFPHSTVHYLDTTYRFNSQIGAVANRFILQNPAQMDKTLSSHKEIKQKSVYLASMNRIEKTLDQLNRQAKSKKTVLLLGRNHYHRPELLEEWKKQYRSLELEFMTCHASKGKEADFVLILAVDEGQFPTKVKSLHLNGALTESRDSFAYAEERRLFYVAMTRAKEKVWIFHTGNGSGFVQELSDSDYPIVKQK
ncbi:DNA helicase IV [Vibrio genomosp. F10 str. ZF-129]|uniref:DNA 3'-5' helicase n=1 Tax=Vibrio genomosp. F10 str. ZF-129 TaxID=1187848 RepID=A0A1E5BB23_9VIBR|nr:DNA helicase IV [Vibrio genomosp. F10]OEE31305.1 DNA helicase IV [Vibrio genomosp. F10 str. ZF-129]